MQVEFSEIRKEKSQAFPGNQHPDFRANTAYANLVARETPKNLPPEITIFVGSSQHGDHDIFWIKFKAPYGVKFPDYSNVISLNMDNEDFKKQIKLAVKTYQGLHKRCLESTIIKNASENQPEPRSLNVEPVNEF